MTMSKSTTNMLFLKNGFILQIFTNVKKRKILAFHRNVLSISNHLLRKKST